MPAGIYFGKVAKFDLSMNSWMVKYEDERLTAGVFSYDELCICLKRYRSYKKRAADKMTTGDQASADLRVSPDQAIRPLKKARVTLSSDQLKMEYRNCLELVLDTLQRHGGDTSKLKKMDCCVLLYCGHNQLYRYKSVKHGGKDGVQNILKAANEADLTWMQNCNRLMQKNNDDITATVPMNAAIPSNPTLEPHFEPKNIDTSC